MLFDSLQNFFEFYCNWARSHEEPAVYRLGSQIISYDVALSVLQQAVKSEGGVVVPTVWMDGTLGTEFEGVLYSPDESALESYTVCAPLADSDDAWVCFEVEDFGSTIQLSFWEHFCVRALSADLALQMRLADEVDVRSSWMTNPEVPSSTGS